MTKDTNAAVVLVEAFDPEKFFTKGTAQKALDALEVAKPDKPEYFKDFFVDGKPVVPGSEKFYEKAIIEPWKSDDNPEVVQWLKDNDAPLAKMVEAAHAKLTRFFIPIIPVGKGDEMPSAMCNGDLMQGAAKALMIRANLAIGDGKFADAWRDITAVYRLGTLYGQQAMLADRAVGLTLVDMALKATVNFANSDKLPHGQARGRLGSFASGQFAAVPDAVTSIDAGQRYYMLAGLTTKGRGFAPSPEATKAALAAMGLEKIPPEFVLKAFDAVPDSSLPDMAKQINDCCDQMVKVMSLATYGQQAPEFKKFNDQATALKNEMLRPKYLQTDDTASLNKWANSYMMFSMYYSFPKAQLASYRAATQKKLATIALALAAYKSDKGKYPSGIAELEKETTVGTGKTATKIPAYLKTVPVDFFTEKSDKPFVYKTEGNGYTLYSIGENMKDDAGKDSEHGGDDIVIQKQ